MSIFIHNCIACQQNEHINQKNHTATKQTFSENASYFNYRISMDTKGPINPPSNQNSYIHKIVDAFNHIVVTLPIEQNNAQNAVNSLLHHWITKFGPPVYLVTDRGSEYINSELANLCTTMGIRHSPRTLYAPWTNGLVENHNKSLGTHLRLFLHNTPENWSNQVHMYAYAHNSQPLSELNLSPYEIVRIGPFKIIDKISDITYEIFNQDGYTSHIQRNHLVPYYPKEPLISPFIQNYNPYSFNNITDKNNSSTKDSINPFISFSDEEQLVEDKITISNNETEIPSTIDFQPEPLNQYSSFPYKQNKQQSSYTDSEDQSNIHDYDNFINPRRHTHDRYDFRPQPPKDYRLFLGEKDIISFSQKSC